MRSIVTTLALTCIISYTAVPRVCAQDMGIEFAAGAGSTSSDNGQGITVDAAGNIYTTGHFSDTVDFDPSPGGTLDLMSAGAFDIFVQKLDADGNFVWAKSVGGTGADRGYGIAVDASGNVYTSGAFQNTVDFDPSPGGTANRTSAGNSDIFVQKLDSDGNFVWAEVVGSTGLDASYAIALDNSANVHTTGVFASTMDFDPSPGTTNLTNAGSLDVFVQKLDTDGNFVWAKSVGNTSSDQGRSIAVDASGGVYTAGVFQIAVDFDSGAGTAVRTSAGSFDIFVQKLDSSGNFLWAKAMGGTGVDTGYGIALDASGNAYTTGVFETTVDFDPDVGTANRTSAGSSDVYVQKLDSAGNFLWAETMGGTGVDISLAVGVDASGNVCTTGFFIGTADFDPSLDTANLISAGGNDIFVQRMDSAGNFVWAEAMGGTSSEQGNGIVLDASGSVYTTGKFSGTADFDPRAGTTELVGAGSEDIFVSKLVIVPVVISVARVESNPTNVSSLSFTVTFSESVTGVDEMDFLIDAMGGIAGASVTGGSSGGDTYTVVIDTGTGDGTISVELIDNDSIVDSDSDPLGGTGTINGDFTAGETYTIDKTAPVVTINSLSTIDPTPSLTGSVDDALAVVSVTVDGQTNAATNNGDLTWTLADDILTSLNEGTYDVSVTATDQLGNAATDATTDELAILSVDGLPVTGSAALLLLIASIVGVRLAMKN